MIGYRAIRQLLLSIIWLIVLLSASAAPAQPALPSGAAAPDAETPQPRYAYPAAHRDDVVDDYHGTKAPDPYRWLEDPDSAATRSWVTAQNQLTAAYLEQIPAREAIRARLTTLWNFEKYGVPIRRGKRYFYTKNDGLQNQSVLYAAESATDAGRVLLDPNKLSDDGTAALSGMEISDDGAYLAYGIASAGSDWQEWRVRDVANGEDLADHLRWIKFSGASWLPDGSGFYYSRYDEPSQDKNQLVDTNYYQKLFFHRLGTPQSQDRLVYERRDQKEWGFAGQVTDDGAYLIITASRGTEQKSGVFFQDLRQPGATVQELLTTFDAEYEFVANEGPLFYFRTDHEAPLGRVIAIDSRRPAVENWRQVTAEGGDVLEGASRVGDQLFLAYLADAASRVRRVNLKGQPLPDVTLPGLGTATGFSGRRGDRETFFSFASFNVPGSIYRFDLTSGETSQVRAPRTAFNPHDYVVEQVKVSSRDGTQVPVFLARRRDVAPGPQTPVYLFGYGGFNISYTPLFSAANLAWLDMGGVFALANLRGGGEYGRAWHEAGQKHLKQNVFDDFIAVAEWLVREGRTARDKLAIGGRSNGGLLVGACLTQRPDLYRAAVPAVGVLDMLRFHKFTIGWAWTPEYGSADDPAEFAALFKYSPLHNIRRGTAYPATLVTTADHDDRVVPAHSYKFAAALQAAHAGPAPVLIRVETQAGHGAGKPTAKLIDEATDVLSFLVRELGVDVRNSPQTGGR